MSIIVKWTINLKFTKELEIILFFFIISFTSYAYYCSLSQNSILVNSLTVKPNRTNSEIKKVASNKIWSCIPHLLDSLSSVTEALMIKYTVICISSWIMPEYILHSIFYQKINGARCIVNLLMFPITECRQMCQPSCTFVTSVRNNRITGDI